MNFISRNVHTEITSETSRTFLNYLFIYFVAVISEYQKKENTYHRFLFLKFPFVLVLFWLLSLSGPNWNSKKKKKWLYNLEHFISLDFSPSECLRCLQIAEDWNDTPTWGAGAEAGPDGVCYAKLQSHQMLGDTDHNRNRTKWKQNTEKKTGNNKKMWNEFFQSANRRNKKCARRLYNNVYLSDLFTHLHRICPTSRTINENENTNKQSIRAQVKNIMQTATIGMQNESKHEQIFSIFHYFPRLDGNPLRSSLTKVSDCKLA